MTCVLQEDELIPKPAWQATRAIIVNTTPQNARTILDEFEFDPGKRAPKGMWINCSWLFHFKKSVI